MSSEKVATLSYSPSAIIPPSAYHLTCDGCKNIRVFLLPPDSEQLDALKVSPPATPDPTVIKDTMEFASDDEAESKSQTATMVEPVDDGKPVPDYYISRSGCGDCTLYEGAGPQKKKKKGEKASAEPRKLMEFKGESLFGSDSSFNEVGGTGRQARMFKVKDGAPEERDAWYHIRRTLEDFNGVRYKWDTSGALSGHLTLIRLSDGAAIAYFRRSCFKWREVGFMETLEPMSVELFHLVLSSFYAKYTVDKRRRRAIYSSMAAGASGGP